jgi:hypothetical protein
MQALKALVIFMGIVIVVGVAVVGITIFNRATKMPAGDKPAPAAASIPPLAGAPTPQSVPGAPTSPTPQAPGAATNFGVRDLGLPAGSSILSVQPLNGRVLVQARLPDGATRILLLDPATGAIAGEWRAPGGAAGTPAPPDGSGAQPPPAEGSGRP